MQLPGFYQFSQIRIHHIADVILPGIYQIHFPLLHIKAYGFESVLGLVHSQGQSHISQAAYAHDQGLVLNLFQ